MSGAPRLIVVTTRRPPDLWELQHGCGCRVSHGAGSLALNAWCLPVGCVLRCVMRQVCHCITLLECVYPRTKSSVVSRCVYFRGSLLRLCSMSDKIITGAWLCSVAIDWTAFPPRRRPFPRLFVSRRKAAMTQFSRKAVTRRDQRTFHWWPAYCTEDSTEDSFFLTYLAMCFKVTTKLRQIFFQCSRQSVSL